MQRQQFSPLACRECFAADQWRAMTLRWRDFLVTWRDFGESRQCGVAHWLAIKWVSFSFVLVLGKSLGGTERIYIFIN